MDSEPYGEYLINSTIISLVEIKQTEKSAIMEREIELKSNHGKN